MPLGNTAKKIQKVADTAEDVYAKLNDLREQVVATKETVEETSDRMDRLEAETAEQRAILEALADERGVDVDSVVAKAHIGEAETEAEAEAETETEADAETDDADTAPEETTDDADET